MRRVDAAALIAILAGCTTLTEPELGDEFALRPGESVVVSEAGLRVRFVGVEGDSRCPSDGTCIWAGDASVVVETVADGKLRSDTLHTFLDPKTLEVGRVELTLVRLDPHPRSDDPISPDRYLAVFDTASRQ